jgi:hypothetical protein
MSDSELEQIIGKARRLRELRRAKERVRRLERELRGEPPRPEEPTWVPEFLRTQTSSSSLSAGGPRATQPNGHPLRADRWPNRRRLRLNEVLTNFTATPR